jgi:chaperone BCS1
LAKEFASKVPELKFSLAEIFSFLLEYRKSPEEAINNVEQLISKLTQANSKLLETSKDVKPKDVQSGIARDPKLVRL